MNQKKYLPILDEQGQWIERIDLFILLRVAKEDKIDNGQIFQIHKVLCEADNSKQVLNGFEQGLERREIRNELRLRYLAAAVLFEMVRIAQEDPTKASLGNSIRVAAYNQHLHQDKSAEMTSIERSCKNAFMKFRSTVHLQLAVFGTNERPDEMEGSLEKTLQVLARAKAYEDFIDLRFSGSQPTWNPWRVPDLLEPSDLGHMKTLTDSEINLLKT
jgi:hypothetical protein